jgi:hypothetical protein
VTEPTAQPPERQEPPDSEPAAALPAESVPAIGPPSSRRRLIGIGAGLAGYVLALLLAVLQVGTTGEEAGYILLVYAIFAAFATVFLVIAGLILLVPDRTRAIGIGVLIAVAIGVFCGGGICFGIAAAS